MKKYWALIRQKLFRSRTYPTIEGSVYDELSREDMLQIQNSPQAKAFREEIAKNSKKV